MRENRFLSAARIGMTKESAFRGGLGFWGGRSASEDRRNCGPFPGVAHADGNRTSKTGQGRENDGKRPDCLRLSPLLVLILKTFVACDDS